MIRELVGGIYFGEKEEGTDTGMKYARDDCIYTEEQVRAIGKIAFDEARRLGVRMTHVHKSNVLATSRLWDAIIEDMAKEYDDVEYVSIIVDNAAFQLVRDPQAIQWGYAFGKYARRYFDRSGGGLTRLSRPYAFGVYGARKGLCGTGARLGTRYRGAKYRQSLFDDWQYCIFAG